MASEINVDKITPQTGTTLELGDSGDTITVTGTLDGSGLTGLNADNLASGTVPDARFPATLPAVSGANLTNLDASDLVSGTIPDARFPATLPALNGSALTNLTSGNLTGALPALNGSALTNLTSANLTGALPAIDGSALTNLPSGGKVLQVQYYYNKTKTAATSSSNLWENINITPSSTSSKILLLCTFGFGNSNLNGGVKIQRGSSNIMPDLDSAYLGHPTTSQGAFATPDDSVGISNSNSVGEYSFSYLDTPNTTSQVSYRLRYVLASGYSGTIYFNRSANDNGSQCISTVTLLEIEG